MGLVDAANVLWVLRSCPTEYGQVSCPNLWRIDVLRWFWDLYLLRRRVAILVPVEVEAMVGQQAT